MGYILPSYKKAVVDEIINGISSNSSQYYAFASNPVPYVSGVPAVTTDDNSTMFKNNWNLLFGKKIQSADVAPIISKNYWSSGTTYNMYDNTVANLSNYYVVVNAVSGGFYNIYKCIYNGSNTLVANGIPSTISPSQIQLGSFTTGDGYIWRYITSISAADNTKFGSSNYIPVIANTAVVSQAFANSGVEVVKIISGGSGYSAHYNGNVVGVATTTLVQIDAFANPSNNFYTNNSVYFNTSLSATSNLKTITNYVVNSAGKWIYLDSAVDPNYITSGITFSIAPRVFFQTDATIDPKAVCTVDANNANAISSITIIDRGAGVSWANVTIQSNTNYGTGANLYAVMPFPGGHGSNPAAELGVNGLAIAFNFYGTEANTIPTNVQYNKIGIIKNPYTLNSDGSKSTTPFSTNTFNNILVANTSTANVFAIGDIVTGLTSGALGTVAFSNSSQLYLTGDKNFTNNEIVVSSNGLVNNGIAINTIGNIYAKDIIPLYVQNISNVNRSTAQEETFKLIIQI
jgi:hypothetical protein